MISLNPMCTIGIDTEGGLRQALCAGYLIAL